MYTTSGQIFLENEKPQWSLFFFMPGASQSGRGNQTFTKTKTVKIPFPLRVISQVEATDEINIWSAVL